METENNIENQILYQNEEQVYDPEYESIRDIVELVKYCAEHDLLDEEDYINLYLLMKDPYYQDLLFDIHPENKISYQKQRELGIIKAPPQPGRWG